MVSYMDYTSPYILFLQQQVYLISLLNYTNSLNYTQYIISVNKLERNCSGDVIQSAKLVSPLRCRNQTSSLFSSYHKFIDFQSRVGGL